MSNVIQLSSYIPKKGDKFFLDTNVWMYLYCSIGNYKQSDIEIYSDFYEKILKSNAEIYTSSLQISEFFNAYCRLEFKFARKSNPKIKNYKRDFRGSEIFIDLMNHLKQLVNKKILKNSIRLDDDFSNVNLEEFMSNEKSYDFNDEYFIQQCVNNSIIIVTNDRDFLDHPSSIQILTNLI